MYYSIKKGFAILHLKATTFLSTVKMSVLLLLQGCYNIKEIAVQFLADRALQRSLSTVKMSILLLLQGCYKH